MKKKYANKKTVYEQYLVVEGAGSFPFDMLRYDSCFPLDQTDSIRLEHHKTEPRRVVVVRRGVNPDGATPARWRSFGWVVVAIVSDLSEAITLRDKGPTGKGAST